MFTKITILPWHRDKYLRRFETKFIKTDQGCWYWAGALDQRGYGFLKYKCKRIRAHRFSWTIYKDEIPEGMLVLHKCNNKRCVNPEHLYIGDDSDNLQDALACKDRRGQALSGDDVRNIRRMLRDEIKGKLIAWIYQVTPSNVSCIKNNKIWEHATL